MADSLKTRVDAYLAGNQKCPFCGSEDLDYGSGDFGTEASQEVTCMECGASWNDRYLAAGIDVVSYPDELASDSEVDEVHVSMCAVPRNVLLKLLGMASSYVEDIESGIEEGLYDAAENRDLDEMQQAIRNAEAILGMDDAN